MAVYHGQRTARGLFPTLNPCPPGEVNSMANYKKYDPRLESLVIETRTLFAPEIE